MKLHRHGKLLFIALTAAVTATAAQAAENVTVYGKARTSVNFTDATGATSPGDTTSISSNNSRLASKLTRNPRSCAGDRLLDRGISPIADEISAPRCFSNVRVGGCPLLRSSRLARNATAPCAIGFKSTG